MADLYTIQNTLDNILFVLQRGGGTSTGNSSNNNASSGGLLGDRIVDKVRRIGDALTGLGKAASTVYLKTLEKEQNIWLQQQQVYGKTLETGSNIFKRSNRRCIYGCK